MYAYTANFVSTSAVEDRRRDFECCVSFILTAIYLCSMCKTEERGLNCLWPLPPISENAPDMDVNVIGHDVRDVRHDHDFHGLKNGHHSRHAVPPTGCSGPVITRPACRLVSKVSLIDRL